MDEIRDLYQEVILDHNKRPQNYHAMEDADASLEGFNPLCGDHYTLFVKFNGNLIADVSFQGNGCAISKASASMMSAIVKGRTMEEADHLFRSFHDLVTGKSDPMDGLDELGKLAAFSGVSEFPVRVKCATLPWHTLHAVMEGSTNPVTTE